MKISGRSVPVLLTAGLFFYSAALFAQQAKGDKEVGLGGSLSLSHASPMSGDANFQASFGYFLSAKSYVGVEVDPMISWSAGDETTSSSVSTGGFFGGNYRRMLGNPKGKFFLFVGGGGGGLVLNLGQGLGTLKYFEVYPEFGIKSYISQKTSLEFSYKMLIGVNQPSIGGVSAGNWSFQQQSRSLATISMRHIF